MKQWCVSSRPARVFAPLAFGVIALGVAPLPTLAQTTVTLNDPTSEVVYATIRGGSYANSTLRTLLATRASSNPEYHRRALLKFDTHNGIPAGSTVTSALLTITVKLGSEDKTRSIAAYQITTSWNENEVTWRRRRTSAPWICALSFILAVMSPRRRVSKKRAGRRYTCRKKSRAMATEG